MIFQLMSGQAPRIFSVSCRLTKKSRVRLLLALSFNSENGFSAINLCRRADRKNWRTTLHDLRTVLSARPRLMRYSRQESASPGVTALRSLSAGKNASSRVCVSR
jgi:hypothetical protein